MKETLEQERERLKKRLELLNVRSTGSDRIKERLRAIDEELEREGVRGA